MKELPEASRRRRPAHEGTLWLDGGPHGQSAIAGRTREKDFTHLAPRVDNGDAKEHNRSHSVLEDDSYVRQREKREQDDRKGALMPAGTIEDHQGTRMPDNGKIYGIRGHGTLTSDDVAELHNDERPGTLVPTSGRHGSCRHGKLMPDGATGLHKQHNHQGTKMPVSGSNDDPYGLKGHDHKLSTDINPNPDPDGRRGHGDDPYKPRAYGGAYKPAHERAGLHPSDSKGHARCGSEHDESHSGTKASGLGALSDFGLTSRTEAARVTARCMTNTPVNMISTTPERRKATCMFLVT
jgi:hypothetical protein